MGIFSRRKGASADGDTAASEATQDDVTLEEAPAAADPASEASAADEPEFESEAARAARRQRSKLRPRDDIDRSWGPFDASEIDTSDRLNFGSLLLTPVEGAELRLDVDETSQIITGVTALFGPDNSAAVQIQVFAAPKTSGIWYGIRREIAESLTTSGGTADEVDGPLGVELHAQMPTVGPDGRTAFSPARFIGVDGPRWFLRAVFSGQAALDAASAEQAMNIVKSVAVHRGSEPRAPRELLELTIPHELLQQEQPESASHPEPDQDQAAIQRMERGPEITEIR